jgi:hypothetical protein
MNPQDIAPKSEPVIWGFLAKAIAGGLVTLAAKYGLHLDAGELIGVLLLVEGAIAGFVRSKVHPASKVAAQIGAARAEGIAIGSGQVPS